MARPKNSKSMTPVEAAAAKPKSAKLAIAAFCYNCMGANSNRPHVTKTMVRDCTAKDCALYPHRGWQHITTNIRRKPQADT